MSSYQQICDHKGSLMPEIKDKLLAIFSYFNICHLYETQGEFFLSGFPQITHFESGVLIEIWFPQCELSEFFDIFDLIFDYMDIKYCVTLTDLVNGETLVKNVLDNLKLDSYNPLTNLIWNKQDQIWMNHRQYNENFKPLYPDLFYGKNQKEKKKHNPVQVAK